MSSRSAKIGNLLIGNHEGLFSLSSPHYHQNNFSQYKLGKHRKEDNGMDERFVLTEWGAHNIGCNQIENLCPILMYENNARTTQTSLFGIF